MPQYDEGIGNRGDGRFLQVEEWKSNNCHSENPTSGGVAVDGRSEI